jgi:hypothetical protein
MEQGGSNVNPLALIFLLAMGAVVFSSNRRNAVGAMLITAAFIPLGQEIRVAGLHLYFLRLLILVGLSRLVIRHEAANFKLATVDKLFIWWILVGFICQLIRGPKAETFGGLYDTAGAYFIIRILTRDATDVLAHLRILAFLGIAIGICMTFEVITHRNPFYIMGGVPEYTVMRGDRFRCQGSFQHPILTGTFGATLLPLLIGLWRNGGCPKWLVFGGLVGSLTITVTSASSGPLLTFLAAIAGFCLWPMRRQMRFFRRGVVLVILLLAMVMKAPVWFLIGKISDLTGGGGYYRSYLIDVFIRHFTQWCWIGTSYTANWATGGIGNVLSTNPDMIDLTNHFVVQGVTGGLLDLVLFIAMLVACFKVIGRLVCGDNELTVQKIMFWSLGVCLTGHCTAFISVSYFDQINVFWFWLLAVIAGASGWGISNEETLITSQTSDNVQSAENAV